MKELISDINKMIKSNSHRNSYTKNEWCDIKKDDLATLNGLLDKAMEKCSDKHTNKG